MDMASPLEVLVAPAGGGIWMSTADLCRFGQEHMNGLNGKDGILKAETVKRLHTGEKEPEGELIYACGWGIESFPGVETFHGHNGSNGTMRAQLCVFPKAGVVVACIVNSGGEIGMSPGLQAALAIASRYAKQ
jgi:CubicO group peptidase (beta-lactamase class C family)